LEFYSHFATEKEMLQTLIQKPAEALIFFEYACQDEEWIEQHLYVIRWLIRWISKSFYLSQLPAKYVQRFLQLMQQHYQTLKPFLFFQNAFLFNIHIQLADQTRTVNSFLFGAASSRFAEQFKRQFFYHFRDTVTLDRFPVHLFLLVEEHIYHGHIEQLWRQSQETIMTLMHEAHYWNLNSLEQECALILKRYLTKENVIESILQAHRLGYLMWKQICEDFFNQHFETLHFIAHDELYIELFDLKQDTLDIFILFTSLVTHVACAVQTNALFIELLQKSPHLKGIDLSSSKELTLLFEDIPPSIQEINLSGCAWLQAHHLKQLALCLPHLHKLYLNSNLQLNYLAWGELRGLSNLEVLHVARCHQVDDAALRLISQSVPRLIELNLQDCRSISDQGMLELIQACPLLTTLNISECSQLSNQILIEWGLKSRFLNHLDLHHCKGFTEEGINKLRLLKPNLKILL
jgi:hypothetical protein